jgi:hypothetical protein
MIVVPDVERVPATYNQSCRDVFPFISESVMTAAGVWLLLGCMRSACRRADRRVPR